MTAGTTLDIFIEWKQQRSSSQVNDLRQKWTTIVLLIKRQPDVKIEEVGYGMLSKIFSYIIEMKEEITIRMVNLRRSFRQALAECRAVSET